MSAFVRRLIACVSLAVFLGTLALPFSSASHLAWNDDADCAPVGFGPHHASASLTGAGTNTAGGHCALCHWLRAFAGASLTPPQSQTPAFDARESAPPLPLAWYGRIVALDRPSRAPPSLL